MPNPTLVVLVLALGAATRELLPATPLRTPRLTLTVGGLRLEPAEVKDDEDDARDSLGLGFCLFSDDLGEETRPA